VTDLLKQAVDRSPFIDHTQSMNLFMEKVSFKVLNSSHFYSWKNGLKTGMYYLRTQLAVDPIKFGLDPLSVQRIRSDRKDSVVVYKNQQENKECESCSA
jgi:ribonucleotide reductase alpha subunit